MICLECKREFAPAKRGQKICGRECAGRYANGKRLQKYRLTVGPRFWERVDKNSECWIWTGATSSEGYGNVRVNSSTWLTHRLAWKLTHGQINDEDCVLHRCDNPPCVNPSHLFIGDRVVNNKDKVSKGRQPQHHGVKNPNAKLTAAQIEKIRELYSTGNYKQAELAALFGVIQPHISRIIRKEAWSWSQEH